MRTGPRAPPAAIALIRSFLAEAERDEVEADIREEYAQRCARDGVVSADAWVWRQAWSSMPALARRAWWRGWNGFESQGNRNRPGGSMLEQWIQDTRFAMRRLQKRPMFTVLAVLTLALGVGGTAAVYSLVRSILLEPLPYRDPSSLVSFWNAGDWSQAEYVFLRENPVPGFAGIASYTQMDLTFTPPAGGVAKSVSMILPSANLFDVLGVRPLLGRTFQPGDDQTGAASVAVLSYPLWQKTGGQPSIIGQQVSVGGESHTVIGVMPRGFWFPDAEAALWVNSPFTADNRSGNYTMVARMEPGRTVAGMAGPLQTLTTRLRERFTYSADWDKTRNAEIEPLVISFEGDVRPMLLATMAAMALILLIACSNVAALMLGQVDGRSTEFAVRSALGASRRQLMQQLMIETIVLGVCAGVAGTLIATGAFRLLIAGLPLGAMLSNATLDWRVFSAAMLISLFAAALVGIAPAVSLWRGDLRTGLSHSRSGIGARGGIMENGLVIAEVALAVLLIAGAALLIRTVENLRHIDAGIDVDRIAVLDVVTEYMTPQPQRALMLNALIPALEALPGVESAALTQRLPLRGGGDNWGMQVEGIPAGDVTTTAFRVVTPSYLRTMGMDIIRGRDFTEADASRGESLVILNEAAEREFFRGENAIGRRVMTGSDTARVIGIVSNAAEATLTSGPVPARYMLTSHIAYTALKQSIVLRVRPGLRASSILADAANVIERDAPIAAVQRMTTMRDVADRAVGPALQLMTLLVLLGALALVLGAIGVYGVVSHYVARRKREWSIRIALGLKPAQLVSRIVTRGLALVATGAVIGTVLALVLMRVLATFLYDVQPADSVSLVGAMMTLVLVGMVAAFLPARRAGRTDPATVLREQ
jgi:predicted permease